MTQTKQDPIEPDSVWYGTGPHQMWPPLVQHWIKQNLTSFGMVQDPIKLDIICCDTGPSQFFLCLERYKILSNLTLLEQCRTLSNSVAKPELELVKPKLFETWSRKRSRRQNYISKKFTAVSLEEVRMKKNLQWDVPVRISYGTTVTAQFQVAKYGSSWSWSRGWSQK